ncbi:hypothetical protein AGIG_G17474 [Arapaima gigas]
MLPLRAESDGPPVGVPQMKLTVVRRKLADPKSGCFSKRFDLTATRLAGAQDCLGVVYPDNGDKEHDLCSQSSERPV